MAPECESLAQCLAAEVAMVREVTTNGLSVLKREAAQTRENLATVGNLYSSAAPETLAEIFAKHIAAAADRLVEVRKRSLSLFDELASDDHMSSFKKLVGETIDNFTSLAAEQRAMHRRQEPLVGPARSCTPQRWRVN